MHSRGQAPIEPSDPKNPLGKFWIALAGVMGKAEGQQSYGIHGTIDPDSIGQAVSRGCIHLGDQDVQEVFALLTVGSRVLIRR